MKRVFVYLIIVISFFTTSCCKKMTTIEFRKVGSFPKYQIFNGNNLVASGELRPDRQSGPGAHIVAKINFCDSVKVFIEYGDFITSNTVKLKKAKFIYVDVLEGLRIFATNKKFYYM